MGDGPILDTSEGLLVISLSSIGKACGIFPGKSKPMKLRTWWHHAFLQPGSDRELILELSKVWIGGLQRDVDPHKRTPRMLQLVATFEDLRAASPEDADAS